MSDLYDALFYGRLDVATTGISHDQVFRLGAFVSRCGAGLRRFASSI
jgi:hypothetical protein